MPIECLKNVRSIQLFFFKSLMGGIYISSVNQQVDRIIFVFRTEYVFIRRRLIKVSGFHPFFV